MCLTLVCSAECVIVLSVPKKRGVACIIFSIFSLFSIKNVCFALMWRGILEIPIKGLVYRMAKFALCEAVGSGIVIGATMRGSTKCNIAVNSCG